MPETGLETRSSEFLLHIKPVWRGLHASARQYMGTRGDADDLVQEAIMRAWRSFSPSDASTYSKAWLFVILRNVAFEWRRQSKRRVRLVPLMDAELTDREADYSGTAVPAPLVAADDAGFVKFVDERVTDALERLEAPMREVVMLSVAGGLSYREIAVVLDCPVGTVMSRMARARRRLREELAGHARVMGWTKGVCP